MNNQHKAGIIMHEKSKATYESILDKIKEKLDAEA